MKRKIIGILVCTLMIAATVLPVAGNINIEKKPGLVKPVESNAPLKQFSLRSFALPPWLLALINPDWDCWSDPPNMFSIPTGNIGIGTNNPSAKLDVAGNIAINGNEIIDASGNWVGNITEKLPITGKWGAPVDENGPGYYHWTEKIFNSNPAYLYPHNDIIYVNNSGYYQINVNVVQQLPVGTQGIVTLRRNGIDILVSLEYLYPPDLYISHHFTDVVYLNASDGIGVYSTTATANRYGGSLYSSLSIILLN